MYFVYDLLGRIILLFSPIIFLFRILSRKEDLKRIIKEELGAMTEQDQEEQADPQPELGAGKTSAGEMKKDFTGAGKTAVWKTMI